jgi:hypothetical protein
MKYAQEVSKIKDSNLENNLRKALGVLQEDGVYAMFLWLEDKDKGKNIRKILIDLLNESEIRKHLLNDSYRFADEDFSKFCENLREVAQDIDKLLFMKNLLERTLIYALYHAKIGE